MQLTGVIPPRRPRSGFLFALLLAWFLVCTRESLAAGDDCQAFQWATDSDGTEKAALLVQVSVDGQILTLQLDTGSDSSVLYRGVMGPESDTHGHQLAMGKTPPGRHQLLSRPEIAPGQASGVLGLSALAGRVLLLDYRTQSICFTSPENMTAIADQYLFVPARLHNGKFFLYAGIDGDHHWGYFLDTGASIYDLVVDEAEWKIFTGKSGSEPENHIVRGYSWDQEITTVGARATGNLSLGALVLEQPHIHFIKQSARLFANYPFDARGLIGNAPFLEQRILLDLRPGKVRFGIDKSTLAESSGKLSYPFLTLTEPLLD